MPEVTNQEPARPEVTNQDPAHPVVTNQTYTMLANQMADIDFHLRRIVSGHFT